MIEIEEKLETIEVVKRNGKKVEFDGTKVALAIKKGFDSILLEEDEKKAIEDTDILEWFLKNVDRYDNIRLLKTKLENAIYNELTNKFIIEATE